MAPVPRPFLPRRVVRCVQRLAFDRAGLGAVEFAMIAPFLLLLYLGGSQISMGLTVNRKVQHVASTVNDLVTQSQSLDASQLKGIFNVAKSIVTPYDLAPLRIKVTSVGVDAEGKQTVDWSCRLGDMPASSPGSAFILPASFANLRGRHIVVTETRYDFTPVAGYFATGLIQMGGTSYLNPRNGDSITSSSKGC